MVVLKDDYATSVYTHSEPASAASNKADLFIFKSLASKLFLNPAKTRLRILHFIPPLMPTLEHRINATPPNTLFYIKIFQKHTVCVPLNITSDQIFRFIISFSKYILPVLPSFLDIVFKWCIILVDFWTQNILSVFSPSESIIILHVFWSIWQIFSTCRKYVFYILIYITYTLLYHIISF